MCRTSLKDRLNAKRADGFLNLSAEGTSGVDLYSVGIFVAPVASRYWLAFRGATAKWPYHLDQYEAVQR